ncbi:ATP-dependent (S)-NAD(P)H-hydrate dehydratase [Agrilus planipennis]|uniref:ATP-dependent (S)-NAD(P)H-hydrate dehydratase n=1 Tax=Agrilus planipennis TaxID=224129 RepID=A0A1W4WUV7_AGRPL|nr:ATP-dependent (S)-NAD(P)H-hydrate dehydratase [Agrilus planipennis]
MVLLFINKKILTVKSFSTVNCSNRSGSLNRQIVDRVVFSKNCHKNHFISNMAIVTNDPQIAALSERLAPSLTESKYKGQAGKIGIFGGSLEYTGAPYFAAITALKVGADLAHVFCMKEAATVIKSYSPELIVHPLLDDPNAISKIEPWLERFNAVLIGPGLGREESTFNVIKQIINICRRSQKPLVIDADGLFLISRQPELIQNYPPPGVILTPNLMEFARLNGVDNPKAITDPNKFFEWGKTITLLVKGPQDQIMDSEKKITVSGGGSGRRCGGQGDLLAGSLTTFFTWTLQQQRNPGVPHDDRIMTACYAACKLVRECNARAFQKKGRSMVASDMIDEIHGVFEDNFELKATGNK